MTAIDLTSYAGLQAAIASWLNRADLTDDITGFITLFEARANRKLRVRDMMVRAHAFTNSEFVPLPVDYLENYSLTMPYTSPQPKFTYVPPDEAEEYKARIYTGNVRYYTAADGFFELIPAPQTTDNIELIMIYYARIPALGSLDSNNNPITTNWLLKRSPDLYLEGALQHAEAFLKNDERVPLWTAGMQQIVDEMIEEDERSMRPTTRVAAKRRSFG